MTLTANEVFRDYVQAGLPSSGAHKPKKEEVRALLTRMETELAAGLAQAQIGYKSRAELFQNLAPGEATLAIVRGDSTAEYNGIYRKSGASGTGSWTRIADLPDEIVRFTVTGGSPNAIEVAASPQVPATPGNKLYLLTPVANNTGAVTIAIEGGAAVPIKTVFGDALAPDALLADVPAMLIWSVDHYRLLVASPTDTDAILAAAIAARDAAQNYANAAQQAVTNQAEFATYTAPWTGAVQRTVAGRLRDIVSAKDFGAAGDGVTDDTDALQALFNFCAANGYAAFIPSGVYVISRTLVIPRVTTGAGGKSGFSSFILFGAGSNPVGTKVLTGTTIKVNQFFGDAIQTYQTDDPLDRSFSIFIADLQVHGPRGIGGGFNLGEEVYAGLNISWVQYVQIHNVNVEGMGVGIKHVDGSEIRHTGLTCVTNNYYGIYLERKVYQNGLGDMQVWFAHLAADNNVGRDIYMKRVRSVWISSGQCATLNVPGLTEQPRIRLEALDESSVVVIKNFNAENHQPGQPLIEVTDSPSFALIDISDGVFESSGNNPLIHIRGARFNELAIRRCKFSEGPNNFPGEPSYLVIVDSYTSSFNSNMKEGRIVLSGNSPHFYNYMYRDNRIHENFRHYVIEQDYANAVSATNQLWFDPIGCTSIYRADGQYMATGQGGDGSYRIWWTSNAGIDNRAWIVFRAPILSERFVIVCFLDDDDGASPPQLLSLKFGAAGFFSNGDFSYVRKLIARHQVGARTFGKYIFVATILKYADMVTAGGVESACLSHIFGGPGRSDTGLESFAVYVPRNALSHRHLAHPRMTAPPAGGQWGLGEIIWNSQPTVGGSVGWVNVQSTLYGAPPNWKAFGAVAA